MNDVADAAATLLAQADGMRGLDIGTRQALVEHLIAPMPVGVRDSHLRFYAHSVTEDGRIRKFKEPWTIDWLRSLPAGAVLYDVGANIGITSLIAAERVDRQIQVVALEPAPMNFASLVRNIVLNGFSDRVVALPVGLGPETGVEALNLSTWEPGGALHAFGDFGFSKPDRIPTVEGVHRCLRFRLDNLVRWRGLPFPTHLKIDVDGAEFDVLEGARAVMADPRLRGAQIEVVDRDAQVTQSRKMIDFMQSASFTLIASYPHTYPGVTDHQFCRQ
jgi:FkbM family methyltransferase